MRVCLPPASAAHGLIVIPEISLCDISGITTRAPCTAALENERHMRIEISDFVMRTFDPRFPRAALLCQTCLQPHLSADLRLCCARNLHGGLGCLNFVCLARSSMRLCGASAACRSRVRKKEQETQAKRVDTYYIQDVQ